MTKIIFSTLVLASHLTMANITGSWLGSGKAHDTEGFSTNSKVIAVDINRSSDTASLTNLKWDCDDAGFTWSPMEFKVIGDKLFKEGKETGAIESHSVAVTLSDSEFPTVFKFLMTPAETLTYYEEWKGKTTSFFVEGILSKVR